MSEVRADQWLNLVSPPAFLAPIRRSEDAWWRPVGTMALAIPIGLGLSLAGYLMSGLVNTWLIDILRLRRAPTWPGDLFVAAQNSLVVCKSCLVGGMTETVLVGVISLACIVALLASAVFVYRRPARTWITSAPRFRWRLFLAGLLLFGFVIAAIASVPEAVHGWPDRPVFLKADEAPLVRLAYVAVLIVALPVAAAFEEILCRGWLLQATAAITRNLPAILLVNSLIFSLLHADPDPGRNLARAVLGMVLSWGVLRTGGLEIGIGIHAAQNLVILLLAQTLQQSQAPGSSSLVAIAVNVTVSLIALGVIELVARWAPLRRWTGLADDGDGDGVHAPPAEPHRANSTLAAP
jgi:membrane protease YdiL (CAAX protease family)